jgi:hypothetical protein
MPVEITNMTLRPVLLRLNSGASLHLSPGMTSDAIEDEEVDRNEKVGKLQDRHVIALTESKRTKAQKVPSAKATGKPRKK